jgi:hypothetical protein
VITAAVIATLLAPAVAGADEPGPLQPPAPDVGTRGDVPAANGTPLPSTPDADVDKEVDVPPVIHCLWVVADMDPSAAGVQPVLGELADDLPDLPSPTPCAIDAASGVTLPVGTPGGAPPSVSLRPNGGDLPAVRELEVWAVVSHATGPDSIDGITVSLRDATDAPVEPVGPVTPSPDLLAAALAAGVISGQLDAASPTSIGDLVGDGWGRVAAARFPLSHLDGCGRFAVDVTATASGRSSTASAAIDVVCFQQLVVDFDAVDWIDLVPAARSLVVGDLDPTTTDRPTVANLGNVPMALSTRFAPMCLSERPDVCLGTFGFEVTRPDGVVDRRAPTTAGTEQIAVEAPICPASPARVDFVVDAPAAAPAGSYVGSVRLVGTPLPEADCGPTGTSPPTSTTTTPTSTTPVTTTPATTTPATTTPAPATTAPTTTTPATTTPATAPSTTAPRPTTTAPRTTGGR